MKEDFRPAREPAPTAMTAKNAQKELRRFSDAKKAAFFPRFFKTAKGQYGYGDRFIGVTVPNNRKVAKQFLELPLSEVSRLLHSKIHEDRLLALIILTEQYGRAKKKGRNDQKSAIYRFYLKHLKHINNWDLVDCSAPVISGDYLFSKASERGILIRWARSKDLWERRIAVLSTFAFLRNGEFSELLKLSRLLLKDSEDLMHKAVGWMLREAGKRDLKVLKDFLREHSHEMPRTMLRYSIEKLSKKEREYYMAKKSLSTRVSR
jgi:3-methyladenine DNA glycosylase AlkD